MIHNHHTKTMDRPFVACGLMLATVAATSAGVAGTHYLKSRANAAEYKDKCSNDRECSLFNSDKFAVSFEV